MGAQGVGRGIIIGVSSLEHWEALKWGLNVPGAAQSSLVTHEVDGLNL